MELGDLISNRYQVISKIGEGKFGVVYQAHNIKTKQIVAIKTESTGSPIRLLKNETAVLKYLYDQGCRCCPTVYWYGIHLDTTCLAFSFYTMSLYDYLHIVSVDIDKKYKIMAACIEILESIHKYFVIHRDIKPQNFMIKDGELFIIDFGLATFFIGQDGEHVEDIKSDNLVGTPNYTSYNVHCGHSASRRDDMISLGYMYLWMIQGELSWSSSDDNTGLDTPYDKTNILCPYNVYRREKKSWAILENLEDKKIHKYLEYCYRLEYEGSPLHGELKKIFI